MCGILGDIRFGGQPIDRGLLRRMTDLLRHRGPDGGGYAALDMAQGRAEIWAEGDAREGPVDCAGPTVGLGHRRLSIIDIAGGFQPMSNEDGRVWITYNGEIYNFGPLRAELGRLGHRFKTDHSDTEVVIHAYEQWGSEGCLQRLRGMFAFALVDMGAGRVVLARDRLGKKPLVYRWTPDRLVFASEAKAILADPSVDRAVDLEALADYFSYGYVPSPKTIFAGLRKLPPGHFVEIEMGAGDTRPRPRSYWDVRFVADESLSEKEWIGRLREELSAAVRLRMVSDVPLGAFLSGGADSSTIVAEMSRLQDGPISTFSIGFSEERYNELPYARQVAARYGTDHREEIVAPDAVEMLPKLAWQYDEPFSDPSALPTYYVSRLARREVKVIVSGDGGDELFAGYDRYARAARLHRWADPVPHVLRRLVCGGLGRLLPPTVKGHALLELLAAPGDRRYGRMIRAADWRWLFNADSVRRLGADYENSLHADLWDRGGGDYLARLQYVDLKSYLPEDILTKVDKASMLNSLEVRVPLLDHQVVELAARIPTRFKMGDRGGKYILKKMMADELGEDFLWRSKMGFGVPLDQWFRRDLGEFLTQTLLRPDSFAARYLDMGAVERVVANHRRGFKNMATLIWSMLFFEFWARAYLGDDSNVDGPAGQ